MVNSIKTTTYDGYTPQKNCPLCTQDKPIYQMRNVCCRARFLIHQPTLEQRRGWLELWGKQLGKEQINEIKSLTLKWWESKKSRTN
jgi:hypothetical protein